MKRFHRFRLPLLIAVSSLVLGISSTVFVGGSLLGRRAPFGPASCATPALPGTVLDVTLTDMGDMMRPGMMGMRYGPSGPDNGYAQLAMMRISANLSRVRPGVVSLRVHNAGALTHEVVVLPLGPDQKPGQRAIGADGRVDETSSMGEASRGCGADEGDGILPRANAWTTVTLSAGRYELLCNIAGHYGAGMYTELDIVSDR